MSTPFEAFFFIFCGQILQTNVALSTIGLSEYWYTTLAFNITTLGLLQSAFLLVEVLLLLGDNSAMFQGAKLVQ